MPSAISHRSTPRTLTTMDSTTITARLVAINSRTRFMVFNSPWRSLGGGLYGLQDRARGFLGNDIGGRIGISRGDARKYRCIGYPQPVDAVHPQVVVHHGHRV